MNEQPYESPAAPTGRELAEYGLAASTGLGILVLALAPLAIPFLVLTAVFALPLLLIPLALALVGAVIAAPILLVRGLVRRLRHRAHGVPASAGTPRVLRS
jgi:hypothetical protein